MKRLISISVGVALLLGCWVWLTGCTGRIGGGAGNQNLSGAALAGRDFRGAELSGANLSRANLENARLEGADLRQADLRQTILSGAVLRGARLDEAKLESARLDRADLRETALAGADLSYANLFGADLRGADLRGAILYGADLSYARLDGADLTGADLEAAILEGVALTHVTGLSEEALRSAFRNDVWREQIREIWRVSARACQGQAVPGAALEPHEFAAHSVVLLAASGAPHGLSFGLPEYWYPLRIDTLDLVLCLGREQETRIESCGEAQIGRFQYSAEVRLVAAESGQTLAAQTLYAQPPQPCWAIRDGTQRLEGRHVDAALVITWLWPYVGSRGRLSALHAHTDAVWDVAFSPDGRQLASGAYDGRVIIWDVAARQPIHILEGPDIGSSQVAWSPDGSALAVGLEQGVAVWDADGGRRLSTLRGANLPVTSLAWLPGGALTVGMQSGAIGLLDGQSDRLLIDLDGHTNPVLELALSPGGSLLASAGLDGVILIQGAERADIYPRRLKHLSPYGVAYFVTGIAWSPDGRQLASAGTDGQVIVWDAATGQALHSYTHPGRVLSVDWSPDGQSLAAGLEDGTVWLWDAAGAEQPLAATAGRIAPVGALAWSSDGRQLALGLADGTILIWEPDLLGESDPQPSN